ncbi:cysteine--tRNA ligase [Candidatus Woesearchaeota archaeon]|nr:cysteine--tRNA ligase [Candidatus Woesearchaeota archaeon]MCF7900784.1 cysteine--tRNA ligase [Candidatus Woesearchaeota archaeon]MCF8013086.1 cysteine--tRNA ligase [Candidatus Woesearchaeota archaeon]
MHIKLTNSMGREKQTFKPLKKGEVKIYTCGPTVYNYAHIGNLRAYIFADVLKRTFLFNDYKVKHVINITDVGHLSDDADEGEDKLEKGAKREGKTVWDIAKFYTEAFYTDMNDLNIINPNTYCKATEHIQEMIEMNKKLEKNGFTYIAEGNLYFDTSKFENYWNLIGKKQEEENQQSRVVQDKHKKNKTDFVLWFTRHKHGNHAMEWDSPWGKGFPGWHIECSAMSSKYLGEKIDIHTGGIDHVPIHHTNEIAQSECAYGHKWVNYWLHNEFLVVKDSEKMSKSTGNFLRLQTLIDKGYSPLEYRYFLLGTHYRKKIMFSYEALDGAKNSLKKLKNKIIEAKKEKSEFNKEKYDEYYNKFQESINDDLNTAQALALVWDCLNDKIGSETKLKIIDKFDEILGLELLKEEKVDIPKEVIELAEKRWKSKKNKNWEESDKLRAEIESKGFDILDSKEYYEIKKK